ncbi:aspartate kinase [Aliikangiella sp. IMCC44632]
MVKPWVVLKFGGSSVAEPAHWHTISHAVAQKHQQGLRPILVFSALKNVSNLLEALLHQALAGVHPNALQQLKELHINFASQLHLEVNELLRPIFEQLNEDCSAITKSQQISPQRHAKILAAGELLSTTIGCHYLNQCTELTQIGLSCHWLDIRKVLIANPQPDPWHQYTSATCDYQYSASLDQTLSDLNKVIVTQGFIAANELGETVLLGREGSDTSAAYIGAKLKACSIEIWTDVPGIFTTNPRELSRARQIKSLTYQQAHHLAALGAKVLHPRALSPAQEYQIPVQVKSTSLPKETGTTIGKEAIEGEAIEGATIKRNTSEATRIRETSTASHNPNQALPSSQSAEYLYAITSETPINLIKLTALPQPPNQKALLAEHASKVIAYLGSLGFDLITQQPDQTKANLVFKYSNSDKAEPAVSSLIEHLQQELADQAIIAISAGYACVSLCFSQLKVNQVNTLRSLLAENELPLIDCLVSKAKNSISLISHSQHRLAISQLIHASYIENQADRNIFGKSWLEYEQ